MVEMAGFKKYRYNSKLYYQERLKSFKRDKFTCQFPGCGSKKRIVPHHINTYHNAPFLRDYVNNLITLCHKCHCKVTGREETYAIMFLKILIDKKKNDAD